MDWPSCYVTLKKRRGQVRVPENSFGDGSGSCGGGGEEWTR